MKTLQRRFISDGNTLSGRLTVPDSPVRGGGVFLHGAGLASKDRYELWQNDLARRGYATFAFDFRGCGQSEGEFADGSLANRVLDAEAALNEFLSSDGVDPDRIAVIGSSMGGHVAARLVEHHPEIKALVLQCPAAYGADAEYLRLNTRFTRAIRRPGSYLNSPVFPILAAFSGKLLVVYGEKDTVIPDEVKNMYRNIAVPKGSYEEIPYAGHTMLVTSSPEDRKNLAALFSLAADFLGNYL